MELSFVMLCGIPCSGKSTWVRDMLNYDDDVVVLSTDEYIERLASVGGLTYNDLFDKTIKDATKHLELELNSAIRDHKNIVWDQTNLTPKSRKKKINKIPDTYTKTAMCLTIPLEIALERNRNRPGKFVPEKIMQDMYDQFTVPTEDEGFENIFVKPYDDTLRKIYK